MVSLTHGQRNLKNSYAPRRRLYPTLLGSSYIRPNRGQAPAAQVQVAAADGPTEVYEESAAPAGLLQCQWRHWNQGNYIDKKIQKKV